MTQVLGSRSEQSDLLQPHPVAIPVEAHRHHFGVKRAVSREEWADIRRACYVEHQKIKEIARAHGLRRRIVRAVICPWPD